MNGKATHIIHQLYKSFPFTIPPTLSIQATSNSQNDEPIALLKVNNLNKSTKVVYKL